MRGPRLLREEGFFYKWSVTPAHLSCRIKIWYEMKLSASSATTRSRLTLFTSLFFTMRWAETELGARLTVSLRHNFTRNLKNASCCLPFGAVASWYMEKGWAYVCVWTDFGSSLRLHMLFLRDFNGLLYSHTPSCNATHPSLPGDRYESTPGRQTQMADRWMPYGQGKLA